MNYKEKNNLALKPQKTWESNHLNLKPDDMKKWLTKSPAAIKEQLTAQGNIFTTLLSYTRDVYSRFCEAESEMKNYAAKMISNLLQEYQDPAKKMEMEEAGIDKKFIKELMEGAKGAGLVTPLNDYDKNRYATGLYADEKVAFELGTAMNNVENGWKREKEHEINLVRAASCAARLRIIDNTQIEINQSKPLLDIEQKLKEIGKEDKTLGIDRIESAARHIEEEIDRAIHGREFRPSSSSEKVNEVLKQIHSFPPQQLEAMAESIRGRKYDENLAECLDRAQSSVDWERNRELDTLKELGVTPEEAFTALKQREINEYNQRKTEDQKGQEGRTAAVQRGDVITTYDPNDKDSTGHYNNVRHYYAKEDGSLKPISKEMAGEILKGKQSPNHEQSITNGQKIDAKAIMNYAKIDYGR